MRESHVQGPTIGLDHQLSPGLLDIKLLQRHQRRRKVHRGHQQTQVTVKGHLQVTQITAVTAGDMTAENQEDLLEVGKTIDKVTTVIVHILLPMTIVDMDLHTVIAEVDLATTMIIKVTIETDQNHINS